MRSRIVVLTILMGAFMFSLDATETKYTPTKVMREGWIKGRVTHAQVNLQVPALEVSYDAKSCGSESRKIEAIDIGADGALRNAVVYIKSISSGKDFTLSATPPTLTQAGCRYEPHVQVVPQMSSIKITNEDGILHSVHAFEFEYGRKFVIYPNSITQPAKTLFNIGMVATRKESYQQLNTPGIVKFICDAGHYWMTAYAVVMNHPYYAKVNNDGTYELDNVPPGTYTLVSWHEYFGTQEQTVIVKENQPVIGNFVYKEEL